MSMYYAPAENPSFCVSAPFPKAGYFGIGHIPAPEDHERSQSGLWDVEKAGESFLLGYSFMRLSYSSVIL